jgi:hypothetical protein
MFARINEGQLITARTIYTAQGVFDSNSVAAPDGWHIVADTDTPPIDGVNAEGVPQAVTARQARLALNAAGLITDVEAALSAMPKSAQIEWQYAHEIRRDSPLIAAVASMLGLDDAAIDALFAQAATL